jgi:hypothetical protein
MTTITSYSDANALGTAVGELVRLSLADGARPADLSAALTVANIRIGLQFAPNAGVAFAVVMKAASDGDERDVPGALIRKTMHRGGGQ